MQDRQDFALGQLDRLLEFFSRVDAKATFFFAVVVAMLGVVAANFPVRDVVSLDGLAGGLSVIFLAVATLRIYEALFPHLDGPQRSSLLYFCDIAAFKEDEYVERLKAVGTETVIADAASQAWRNAEILTIKFNKVRAAFRWMVASLPVWLLFLLFVAVREGKAPLLGVG